MTLAIVTGATGGMGQACSRRLGLSHRLLLTDIDDGRLSAFAGQLSAEGYDVAGTFAADLSADDGANRLMDMAGEYGPAAVIVHTAGLSPAQAEWDAIVRINLVGSERLLRAVEQGEPSGLAMVIIASIAGHMARMAGHAELDALFDHPLADDLLQHAAPLLDGAMTPGDPFGRRTPAYAHSKFALIRMCENRAVAWAARRNRIVTLSPGLIMTPMGKTELEKNEGVRALKDEIPIGRVGTALDIANAVEFLASDRASFITGADLRTDGGTMPLVQQMAQANL